MDRIERPNSADDIAEIAEIAEKSESKDTPLGSNLKFGVKWSDPEIKNSSQKYRQYPQRSPRRNQGNFRADNHRKYQQHNRFRPVRRPFEPIVDVAFYQNDEPFKAMVAMMQTSCKTYKLFNVARLMLEKPENFVVTIKKKPNANGELEPLYLSLPDGVPFETEQDVVLHIARHHMDKFFDITEIDVEKPKGNFTSVHRCGITGKLLAPPNYHKYRAIVKEHYESEIKFMSFGKFMSKIEIVHDEAEIQKWLEQMSRRLIYKPKMPENTDDLPKIESISEAKQYLLENFKDKAIKESIMLRIPGTVLVTMQRCLLKKSIDYAWLWQKRIPLDTANRLRGKFRSFHFSVYKNGKSGISYVCAARRKFVPSNSVFTNEIRQLIEFLEKNNGIKISELEQKIRNPTSGISAPIEEIAKNLNWLIHEGYVIEYEDGKLETLPKMEEPREKSEKSEKPEKSEKSVQNSNQLALINPSDTTTLSLRVDEEIVIEPYNRETAIVVDKETTMVATGSSPSMDGNNLQEQANHNRNVFRAKLIERKRLSGPNTEKVGYHLVFENSGGHSYKSGDALAVMPKNPEKDVVSILNRLGLNYDEIVKIGESGLTIGKALTEKLCLTHLPKRFWESLAKKIKDEKELEEYFDITSGDGQKFETFLKTNGLADILQKFESITLSAKDLADTLGRMPPRLYSISSAYSATPDKIHLLVAAVKYVVENNKERRGVASTYLCNELQVGEQAEVFIVNSKFSLPENSADIIMVGPGTGLAPFMSFLLERATRRAKGNAIGRNWLFFGEQHRTENFYYKDELLSLVDQGDLWRLDLAFSRDQEHKIYVQDKMLENANLILDWITNGAYFYLCGDASKMAKDVEATLKTILSKHTNDPDGFVKQMYKDKRYQRDVY